MLLHIVCITICTVLQVIGGNCEDEYMLEKPDFFKACSSKALDFNKCYKDNLQALLWNFKDGIPGLPAAGKFEPVKIKNLKIQQNLLKIEMKNIVIQGIGATKLTRIKQNPKDFSFLVRANVPAIRIDARYKTDGRILFLPLTGKGKLWIEAENADFAIVFKMKLRDAESAENITFIDTQSVHTRIKNFTNFRINLENLFNGNVELEEYINEMFNENWREVIDVLRPTLQEAIDAMIFTRFKKIFNFIPANYFIADMPTAKEFYNENSN